MPPWCYRLWVNVVTLSSPNAVQRVILSTYAWPVKCSIMKDNQSRNLRTSDKPHWLRKLLRMAKVFSAKSLDLYVPKHYKRASFWLHHSIIVSQALGRLRPAGFRFIETHQVVATKKEYSIYSRYIKVAIYAPRINLIGCVSCLEWQKSSVQKSLDIRYTCATMILPFVGECRDIE